MGEGGERRSATSPSERGHERESTEPLFTRSAKHGARSGERSEPASVTVGVLGGGQLGRMLALAGYPLGLRFRTFDPSPEAPMARLAEQIAGPFTDPALLDRFAAGLSVATFEWENVPAECGEALAARLPFYPPPLALRTGQDRWEEKALFRRLEIPTPPFRPVGDRSELAAALAEIGLPAVLKARRMGYDGKGQALLHAPEEAERAWQAIGAVPAILERWAPFDRELSLLAVRGRSGEIASYPLVENEHEGGILRLSRAPARAPDALLQARAEEYGRRVLTALDYVGVLAIEFFQVGAELLANELAPRVHNSGHWTIEGAPTSQFENHLRAILGLPLGATGALGHAAMLNLIGALPDLPPLLDWQRTVRLPGLHLHLYDKRPAPGRKLGHVTIVAPSPQEREAAIARVRSLLP